MQPAANAVNAIFLFFFVRRYESAPPTPAGRRGWVVWLQAEKGRGEGVVLLSRRLGLTAQVFLFHPFSRACTLPRSLSRSRVRKKSQAGLCADSPPRLLFSLSNSRAAYVGDGRCVCIQGLPIQTWSLRPSQLPCHQRRRVAPVLSLPCAGASPKGGLPRRGGELATPGLGAPSAAMGGRGARRAVVAWMSFRCECGSVRGLLDIAASVCYTELQP